MDDVNGLDDIQSAQQLPHAAWPCGTACGVEDVIQGTATRGLLDTPTRCANADARCGARGMLHIVQKTCMQMKTFPINMPHLGAVHILRTEHLAAAMSLASSMVPAGRQALAAPPAHAPFPVLGSTLAAAGEVPQGCRRTEGTQRGAFLSAHRPLARAAPGSTNSPGGLVQGKTTAVASTHF